MYRKGFWLILVEDDGSEVAVACQILSGDEKGLQLRAHIPPSWYPQTFTSFKVRQDGDILGWRRLPADGLIRVPAHAGLHSVDLAFSLDNHAASPQAARVSEPLGVSGD